MTLELGNSTFVLNCIWVWLKKRLYINFWIVLNYICSLNYCGKLTSLYTNSVLFFFNEWVKCYTYTYFVVLCCPRLSTVCRFVNFIHFKTKVYVQDAFWMLDRYLCILCIHIHTKKKFKYIVQYTIIFK